MSKKSVRTLAQELLECEAGGLEEMLIHEFDDDESAHDDELIERLYAQFSAEFDLAQQEITEQYGPP
jgi:hypothetical protein